MDSTADKKIAYLKIVALFEDTLKEAEEIVKHYTSAKKRYKDYWLEAEHLAEAYGDTEMGKAERWRAEIAKKFFDRICEECRYANLFRDDWKASVASLKKNENLFIETSETEESGGYN